jgi:hypothetical protein
MNKIIMFLLTLIAIFVFMNKGCSVDLDSGLPDVNQEDPEDETGGCFEDTGPDYYCDGNILRDDCSNFVQDCGMTNQICGKEHVWNFIDSCYTEDSVIGGGLADPFFCQECWFYCDGDIHAYYNGDYQGKVGSCVSGEVCQGDVYFFDQDLPRTWQVELELCYPVGGQ